MAKDVEPIKATERGKQIERWSGAFFMSWPAIVEALDNIGRMLLLRDILPEALRGINPLYLLVVFLFGFLLILKSLRSQPLINSAKSIPSAKNKNRKHTNSQVKVSRTQAASVTLSIQPALRAIVFASILCLVVIIIIYRIEPKQKLLNPNLPRAIAETEVQALDKGHEPEYSTPYIKPVGGAFIGVAPMEDESYAEVYLRITLENLGAPTIVKSFALSNKDQAFGKGQMMGIPEMYTLRNKQGEVVFTIYAKDALYEKIANHPLMKGHPVEGWLRFKFENVPPPESLANSRWKFSYIDGDGKSWDIDIEGYKQMNFPRSSE